MGSILAEATVECEHLHCKIAYVYYELYQAAKFGRTFLDSYDASDFVNTGHTLRVLNAVRAYNIGIPIMIAQ